MDLSELTPELFEKTEFTERRRGYDIDQVERFLEDTGTAVAQLLVKHRQLEERAAQAEARLAAAESRATAAEEAMAKAGPLAQPAVRPPTAAPSVSEDREIEQATSTLVMAKRTADATIAEARAEAGGIVSEARAQAERIVSEARSEAANELAEGRSRVLETVTALEQRRDAVAAVVTGFEQRIAEYRGQLTEVSDVLASMVADPDALAPRPELFVPESAAGHTEAAAPAAASAFSTLDHPTEAYDTLAAEQGWGEGSWSSIAEPAADPASAAGQPAAEGDEEFISLSDLEPATGQTNDRFLRELDEAVNEPSDSEPDAMTAFFEPSEEPGRRFGWRR